jgi:hypothetical protein
VVVATVDQDDLGIGATQRVRRREPGKATADNDDPRLLTGTVRSPSRRLKFGIRR